ncbi:MAG: hypothetical protein Q4G10_00005, partial [Bacteroidia bacterium]|nr:hypothetical protein [Bacteroidia bacterium]
MKDLAQKVLFFHVCTDGASNGIVHFSDEDYEQANKIAAIAAFKTGVRIIAHSHMSTHSHFAVWCGCREQAEDFGERFKHDYSIYVYHEHGISGVYRRIGATVRQILDIRDLKNCIAYVLLNPVAAHIVTHPENYRWSSFDAYFNTVPEDSPIPVSSLNGANTRKLFRTRLDISASGFLVDRDGRIILKSFVDYRFVERLFGGPTEFFRCLALTNSATEELKYLDTTVSVVRYSDEELRAEASGISQRLFSTRSVDFLTVEQKTKLLIPLQKKTGASASRLARILR